jgi:hypothetical protein
MKDDDLTRLAREALRLLADRCPRLATLCYWAGTSALQAEARVMLAEQDALLIAERLLGWTDADISEDLEGYEDVSPTDAQEARDLLLRWLRESGPESSARP